MLYYGKKNCILFNENVVSLLLPCVHRLQVRLHALATLKKWQQFKETNKARAHTHIENWWWRGKMWKVCVYNNSRYFIAYLLFKRPNFSNSIEKWTKKKEKKKIVHHHKKTQQAFRVHSLLMLAVWMCVFGAIWLWCLYNFSCFKF